MKPNPVRAVDALEAKLRIVEARAADLAARIAALEGDVVVERQKRLDFATRLDAAEGAVEAAEASAKYWRGRADAAIALEARHRDTIVGMGHALADLKLAEADLEVER